ncbi:ERF family protein [Staphylococcus felis]|uniref:ERF family protein n=1 Tax=Staphylococcus felis TaxID=46127 RepID=UPI00396727F9
MSEIKNLYQRINEAKRSMEGFVKDTKGYQYSYVSGSQVLHKLNPELYKNGINITFKTSEPQFQQVKVFVKGKEKVEFLVSLNVHYTIRNVDNPEEKIESTIFAIGQQDDPSKALGTALTYSERYFLMKFFGLPTDEDDADAKQKREQYTKPDAKAIGTLKEEMLKFSELMQSLGKQVSVDDVQKQLGINDIQTLTNAQISMLINKLDNWSKQAKENE